eukprot:sb/3462322/
MTEPPAKRQARCIEDYCEDLRALLVKSPDFWDYKAIEKVLKEIREFFLRQKVKVLNNSTFKYSIPILITCKNLPPNVINSLLEIVNRMEHTKLNDFYRSFVIDNFLHIPDCYLQCLWFLNRTKCQEGDVVKVPLFEAQRVFQYLETRMSTEQNLSKHETLVIELSRGICGFHLGDKDELEAYAGLAISLAKMNSKLQCLDLGCLIELTKGVLSTLNKTAQSDLVERLRETLVVLVEEMCDSCPINLAEVYMDVVGDAKMALYQTAEVSRNKAFAGVLNDTFIEADYCVEIIEAVRDINREGLPLPEEIYQALSYYVSDPRNDMEQWASSSRDALFIFLERGKVRVTEESQKKKLNEVIITFLGALRKIDCTKWPELKGILAPAVKDVIGLAEDTVFRDNALTKDNIILIMDFVYQVWNMVHCIGRCEINKLRQDRSRDLKNFWDFGFAKGINNENAQRILTTDRETCPSEYLTQLSDIFLAARWDTDSFIPSLCEMVELRVTDPPKLLLRLFLCIVRYIQGALTQFEDRSEKQSPEKNGMVRILGEEGAPGVEVNEQDLSSPILKSMLASSFEEGRTRTITVPSAPQRILEALKLILGEGGNGVDGHATLKEVWEWLLPWATMYQVDGVFKYLLKVMNETPLNDPMVSDSWMVEFAIRNKHPVWLTLVSNRFLLVENINLSPQNLIFAVTELFNAIKEKENYLVNIISYYCQHQCFSSEDRKFVPNFLPSPRSSKRKYFDQKRYPFEVGDDSSEHDSASDDDDRGWW